MANEDLLLQLNQNLASFEGAGMTEEVDKIKARIAEVQGGEKTTAEKTTAKRGKA